MHLIHVLGSAVEHHVALAYCIIFFGTLIEGEFVMIASGVLAHIGVLPVVDTVLLGFLGAMGKTVIGYSIGQAVSKYFPNNKFFTFIEGKILHFLPHFKDRPFWSIFLSKFVYGINHLAILFAGFIRAQFKTYFFAELFSSILWTGGVFSLGYFFSYTAFGVSRDIRKALLVILVLVIIFMLVQKLIAFIIEILEQNTQK